MKNVVLIDFTNESFHALEYAIDFTKATGGDLELFNVASPEDYNDKLKQLQLLKEAKDSDDFKLIITEKIGTLDEDVPEYINQNKDKIGFVFCGTHNKRWIETIIKSRALKLLHDTHAHFIFIPQTLKHFRPIKHVVTTISNDPQTLQKIRVLRFLGHALEFKLTFCTYNTNDPQEKAQLNQRIDMAKDILKGMKNIDIHVEYIADKPNDVLEKFEDYARTHKADLVAFIHRSDPGMFSGHLTRFVEAIIRNEHEMPVIAVQDIPTVLLDNFRAIAV
ncbi:MAG: universal stress protein [Crocinitomicaceae bacterium]|nr:universal stress protein [Crocinitomicaceae bacterium]